MTQNDQKNEVFSKLKILLADFSKILTKHATLWILLILKKLGQNNTFSPSYDDKRGQKSLKITTKIKKSKIVSQKKIFFL